MTTALGNVIRTVIPERFRPIGYLQSLTRKQTLCRVRLGPFAGMRYGLCSVGSAYIPKLLGTYERELADLVEVVCSRNPELIIDIGAAEGYYAVGLALRNRTSRVIAFESEESGRAALGDMAELNQVTSRIEIRGKCEAADLESTLAGAIFPIVICDVEGYEEHLLDMAAVPSLSSATILVEMHDFVRPGLTDILRERFDGSHHIRCVLQESRSRSDFPWRTVVTAVLPNSYLEWAVSEWRPVRMSWLWMDPRTSRS